MTITKNNINFFIFITILFSFILKIIYILISEYYQDALFVGADAYGLYLENLKFSFGRGAINIDSPLTFFFFILGKFYLYTLKNYIWAAFFSVLIWLVSYLILFRSMRLLHFSYPNILFATIIYAFLPSIFLITSTTLREVWQLLLINFILYLFIKILIIEKINYFNIIMIVVSSIFLFILHRSLLLFGLFVFFLIFLFLFTKLKINKLYVPGIIFILFVIIIFLYLKFSEYYVLYGFEQLKKGLPLAIEQYQQGLILSAPNARGNYIDSVSIKNYMDLFLFLPTAFIKYLFEPLISLNQISSVKDIVAIFENILRLLLILLFFINIKKKNTLMINLFLLYLFLELVWSVGTINWGTALRHHVPSWGLLIVCSLHNRYYSSYNEK